MADPPEREGDGRLPDGAPAGSIRVTFGRRTPADRRPGVVILVLGAFTLLTAPFAGGMMGVVAAFAAIGIGFWMLGRGQPPFREDAKEEMMVVASPGAILREGLTPLVTADQVQGGWIEPAGTTAVAVVALRDGTHAALWANDEGAARDLLRAVGADERAATMRVARGTAVDRRGASCLLAALFVPALVFVLGYASFLFVAIARAIADGSLDDLRSVLLVGGGALPFGLLLGALADRLGETTLRIGHDGVLVDAGRLRRRFLPHVELEDVFAEDATLHLRTAARDVRVRCGSAEQAAAAAKRVVEARAARSERRGGAEARISRRGEPVERWRARLAGVLEAPHGSYRGAAVDEEQLLALIDDADASPELRVGAAVALAQAAPPTRERVRIAAQAQAEPLLSTVLERAAEGEIDETALAELEASHHQRHEHRRRAAR